MNNKYKIDLHIHTPASKCYLDEKTDETYINILREAVNKKLSIIAITDHNTISGYKRLLEIKEELSKEKKILSEYQNDTNIIKQRIEDINEILDLYKRIWILPGVEITLNPGVHIIVISANDNVNELSEILDEIGYSDDARGSDSEYLPNVDIRNFLEYKLLNDKIVFAPHIDSDKGIYNELDGLYRAEIFKSDVICAVSCNSSTQLDKIQKLIKNDPCYRRNYIWAYLNASDAHKVDDVGKKASFVQLEEESFENLKKALMNATEFVSDIENQGIEVLIKTLIKRQRVIVITDDSVIENEFDQIICAALNSEFRCVLLGVDKDTRILGTNITSTEVENLVDNASKNIKNLYKGDIGVASEQTGNGRFVHVVFLRNVATELCYVKSSDEVYVYDKGKRKAKITEIEKIVQDRLLLELERFQSKNDDTISNIKESLGTVQYPVEKYKLIRTLEKGMRLLPEMVDFKHFKVRNNPNMWNDFSVGNADGCVFVAKNEEVVLDCAVLRFSCPRSNDNYSEDVLKNMLIVDDSYIVITNRGGTYLIEKNEEKSTNYYLDGDSNFIRLRLRHDMGISNYTLIAWLKSKAFLWYITRLTGTTKLYDPKVYNAIIIPQLKCLNANSEIENLSRRILEAEKVFLS